MRISDWSSDVCSSDLIAVGAWALPHRQGPGTDGDDDHQAGQLDADEDDVQLHALADSAKVDEPEQDPEAEADSEDRHLAEAEAEAAAEVLGEAARRGRGRGAAGRPTHELHQAGSAGDTQEPPGVHLQPTAL